MGLEIPGQPQQPVPVMAAMQIVLLHNGETKVDFKGPNLEVANLMLANAIQKLAKQMIEAASKRLSVQMSPVDSSKLRV